MGDPCWRHSGVQPSPTKPRQALGWAGNPEFHSIRRLSCKLEPGSKLSAPTLRLGLPARQGTLPRPGAQFSPSSLVAPVVSQANTCQVDKPDPHHHTQSPLTPGCFPTECQPSSFQGQSARPDTSPRTLRTPREGSQAVPRGSAWLRQQPTPRQDPSPVLPSPPPGQGQRRPGTGSPRGPRLPGLAAQRAMAPPLLAPLPCPSYRLTHRRPSGSSPVHIAHNAVASASNSTAPALTAQLLRSRGNFLPTGRSHAPTRQPNAGWAGTAAPN